MCQSARRITILNSRDVDTLYIFYICFLSLSFGPYILKEINTKLILENAIPMIINLKLKILHSQMA